VVAELGLEHWIDGDRSRGRARVLAGMLVPGLGTVRIGVLTILADVVAGQPASGPITPTTDIDVRLVRFPEYRTIRLDSRVLKAGATLLVTETLLYADGEREPFAVSLATFMNRPLRLPPMSGRPGPALSQPLAERLGARVLEPGSVQLDNREDLSNGHHGTIQGGVMAALAELAVESALARSGPRVVTGIDLRFLNRVKVGPARAVARPLITTTEEQVFGVSTYDIGDGARLVAYATARTLPFDHVKAQSGR
jgi:acyl-coenzyme A thioesterase PaaI-like protein